MKRLTGPIAAGLLLLLAGVAQAAEPLIDVAWVKANLGKPGIVLLDVRGKLDNNSKATYLREHIPGAIYTDYLEDGWRVKDANGTIAMLPDVAKLEKLIGGLGIGNDSHVVIVPNGAQALDMGTATRIYWTFKVLGHDNVSILDGGMMAWTKEVDAKSKKPVNPLEKGANTLPAKSFKGTLNEAMVATKDEVEAARQNGVLLVDNRPNDQYLGVNRHGKSKRSGTIPGAKNLPENWLTANGGGSFRDRDSLQTLYAAADVPTSGRQITFCNTGHWASLGWFVSSELLGNKDVIMYDGSMVEWSGDDKLPIQSLVKVNN